MKGSNSVRLLVNFHSSDLFLKHDSGVSNIILFCSQGGGVPSYWLSIKVGSISASKI